MAATEYTVLVSSMGQVSGKGTERSRTNVKRGGTIKLESGDDRTKRFLSIGVIAKAKDAQRDSAGRIVGSTALSILRKEHALTGDTLVSEPESEAVDAPEGGTAEFSSAEEGTEAGDQAANEAAMAAVIGDNA